MYFFPLSFAVFGIGQLERSYDNMACIPLANTICLQKVPNCTITGEKESMTMIKYAQETLVISLMTYVLERWGTMLLTMGIQRRYGKRFGKTSEIWQWLMSFANGKDFLSYYYGKFGKQICSVVDTAMAWFLPWIVFLRRRVSFCFSWNWVGLSVKLCGLKWHHKERNTYLYQRSWMCRGPTTVEWFPVILVISQDGTFGGSLYFRQICRDSAGRKESTKWGVIVEG